MDDNIDNHPNYMEVCFLEQIDQDNIIEVF